MYLMPISNLESATITTESEVEASEQLVSIQSQNYPTCRSIMQKGSNKDYEIIPSISGTSFYKF